jgi:hypothetical protein
MVRISNGVIRIGVGFDAGARVGFRVETGIRQVRSAERRRLLAE